MPNRELREGIRSSGAINKLSDRGFRLYVNLLSSVDDFGCCEWNPIWLKANAVPLLMWDEQTIQDAMAELEDKKVVRKYEADGKEYAAIEKWRPRQNRKYPKWPVPPWGFGPGGQSHIIGGYAVRRARGGEPVKRPEKRFQRPAARANGNGAAWEKTDEGLLAKCRELGVSTVGEPRENLIRLCREKIARKGGSETASAG